MTTGLRLFALLAALALVAYPESEIPADAASPLSPSQKRENASDYPKREELRDLIKAADAHTSSGEYARSAEIWEKILKAKEADLGPSSLGITTELNNLAYLYNQLGDYSKAEPLYERALLITERVFGSRHQEAALILNNLGVLYHDQGRHAKAKNMHLRALRLREDSLGADHPEVAQSLNNLATVYASEGLYDIAYPLLARSLRIRQKTLGGNHPAVAVVLNNLGYLAERKGDYNLAEEHYLRSLDIRVKALTPDHPDIATSLNNLGLLYDEMGRLTDAERFYIRSLGIRERSLGSNHPDVMNGLENLSSVYASQGMTRKSLESLERAYAGRIQWLTRELTLLSKQDRSAQLESSGLGWVVPFSLISVDTSAARLGLLNRLNRNGLLQDIERVQAHLARASDAQQQVAKRLRELTQLLANVSMAPERRNALQRERDVLQVELYRGLPDLQLDSVSIQVIAKALPVDAALVEFQRFQPFDGKRPRGKRWGTARYVALILKPNGTITPVQLGAAQPIDAAIFQALQASAANTSDATALWGKVSQLVLQPLQPHLSGSRQWFLSPDGELNRVPFAAIPSPQQPGVPLAQAVQLRLLTTGRDLVRLQQPTKPGQAPLVMANPSYDRAQSPAQQETTLVASSADRPQQRSAELNATRWAPLPATQLEGQQVASLLGTTLISGPEATTSALQRSQGPRVLHVATHGFFAPDQDTPPTDPLRAVQDNSPLLRGFRGEDPQLRSGLVLAGANQPEADPIDDGYLTAAEATGLQLDGTELVTLSACSTAQGAIKTGDGVYGLQRSLTVAGARSTLLSLWKVDDAATAEFMQRFYKLLKAGEGRADALKAVQQEFRTDPALKAKGWDSVYSWGAWQLVGDWRPIAGL